MALLFLLLQPIKRREKVLILDEPELGLHPAAIHLLAEHIQSAAREGTQILLATQCQTPFKSEPLDAAKN